MTSKKIVLPADSFIYPSSTERKDALKDYPKFSRFGFKYKSGLESVINDRLPFDEAMNTENLYWWDNCLVNRFGLLQETYVYTMTNYHRGFPDDYTICGQNEIINRILFDYYAEIFYYYFFSTRDIIAQVLRIYYNIKKVEENHLHFNYDFIGKIVETKVKKSATTFLKDTNDAYEFRNRFAHRFTPTLNDYRTVVTEKDGKKVMNLGGCTSIESKAIVDNIRHSLKALSTLMNDLKENFVIND